MFLCFLLIIVLENQNDGATGGDQISTIS